MELLPALFGLGCLATIAFAVRTLDWNTMFLSVVLMAVWAASNVGWQLNAMGKFPIMDVAVAAYGASLWAKDRGCTWKFAFLYLAFSQLLLHVWRHLYGTDVELAYIFALDVTFALELLAVSWEGLSDVGGAWARGVRDLFRAARPTREEAFPK